MSKIFFLISLILCIAHSQNLLGADLAIEVVVTGEESKEFLDAVDDFQNRRPNWQSKFKSLSILGDPYAFSFLLRLHTELSTSDNAYNFRHLHQAQNDFIETVYVSLLRAKNYRALVHFGRILLDLKEINHSLKYLDKAMEFKEQYDASTLDSLEYNFVTVLCYQNPIKVPLLKKAFNVLKRFIYRVEKEEEFEDLFKMFLFQLEESAPGLEQDELVNEVGHFIFTDKYSCKKAFNHFVNGYYGTPHFDRLERQKGGTSVNSEDSSFVIKLFDNAEIEKTVKERKKKFLETAHEQVKQFAVKELKEILRTEKKMPFCSDLVRQGDLSKLTLWEKDLLARHLIYEFNDRLFPHQNIDVKEYLTRLEPLENGLYSKSERCEFLKNEIFSHLSQLRKK